MLCSKVLVSLFILNSYYSVISNLVIRRNMDIKSKRPRGSNFSKEEELLLVRTVAKYKNIIECKVTDKVNNQEKNEAWQKVMHHMNANNTCVRTAEQLRIKYENLKAKARKVVAQNKCTMTGTGGGPGQMNVLDAVLLEILEIINKKTVVGMHSPWDDDSPITQHLEVHPKEQSDVLLLDHVIHREETSTILESDEMPSPYPSEVITIEVEELSGDVNTCFGAPNQLKDASIQEYIPVPSTSKAYDSGENQGFWKETATLSTSKEGGSKRLRKGHEDKQVARPEVPSASKTWDSYTPSHLKTPMSKKLRVNRSASASKDKYYEKKIMLAEEEIKRSQLLQEDILMKRQRDTDEHQKKMELLELDIELKRRMLKQ